MASFSQRIQFSAGKDRQFIISLRRRALRYVAQGRVQRVARRQIVAKALLFGTLTAVAYIEMMRSGDAPALAFLAGTLFQIGALLLAINIGHDAAHSSLTGQAQIDQAIQIVTFLPLGVDAYLWQMRHNKSHHMLPNVNGCDIDIDQNPFFRLSPNQPGRWYFRFQHFYAPFVYCLVALHTVWWQDFAYLFKKDLANLRDIRHARWRFAQFFMCKASYFTLSLGLPALLLAFPWWQIALGYVAATFASSLIFVFLLIGTHFADGVEFPVPDAEGHLSLSWSEHALCTSLDWYPESWLAMFFVGGANAHAAHHLFPRVSHAYYPGLSRLVARAAAEFGITYNRTSLSGSVSRHFALLKKLGRHEVSMPNAMADQ